MVTALLIAAGVAVAVAAAEWLHARRIRTAAHLAFGPRAQARGWTRLAPALRVLGLGLTVFGAVLLLLHDPSTVQRTRSARFSKQLLLCLDVSPSMLVRDAGPDLPKVSRAEWAGKALRPLLDSVDTLEDSRITLVVFYNGAMPLLLDVYDKDVIFNLLDGMPLHHLFQTGGTDLQAGVNTALETARRWARDSATLVVVSDGDSDAGLNGLVPKPPAIAQTIIVGVGDARSSSEINGIPTRQDAGSLRVLATRLGGRYYDCNRQLVPPLATRRLRMLAPQPASNFDGRSLGLASVGVGGLLTGAVGPALLAFGRKQTQPARNAAHRGRSLVPAAFVRPRSLGSARQGELQ